MKEYSIYIYKSRAKILATIYLGNPPSNRHPLQWQQNWFSTEQGASIPQNIMDSFSNLQKIAIRENITLEELCKDVIVKLDEDDKSSIVLWKGKVVIL